jgi:ELP3 family radical SAM enzyme/protein acetyltransferase
MLNDIEDLTKKTTHLLPRNYLRDVDPDVCKKYVLKIIDSIDDTTNKKQFNTICLQLSKEFKIKPSTVAMNYTYFKIIQNREIFSNLNFERLNKGKQVRQDSGIVQVTVLTTGKIFSCAHNCYFCPDEPPNEDNNFEKQPRSYLFKEPAVRRANQNNFEPHLQMWDRCGTLFLCGLKIDKLEVFILGGTWSSYDLEYRKWFCMMLYYAANTFFDNHDERREPKTLEEEIEENERALVRIIGLTPETRPDYFNKDELLLMRQINATRIQIGVQHTNDRILKKNNRGCYIRDVKIANKNGKNLGYKMDCHLMPLMYGTTLKDDKDMFNQILEDPDLQFEQWKIYPFVLTLWTEIEKKGNYVPPYNNEELIDLIIDVKVRIPTYIRNNRIVRDIPESYDTIGNHKTNRRNEIHDVMRERGLECRCIRCREPKNLKQAREMFTSRSYTILHYESCGGDEYFISCNSHDDKYIYGFCRLRISNMAGWIQNYDGSYLNLIPALNNMALVRELHVYGNMNRVDTNLHKIQHQGIGAKLMELAEEISYKNKMNGVAVISGVGVRKYYENKLNYELGSNGYMYKYFEKKGPENIKTILFILFLFLLLNQFKKYFFLYFNEYY